MFDIAFTELLVIGLVALIVIGPERLPKVARTAGQWLGRLNRYVSQVKQDIDRDIKLEELRKMQQEMRETAQKYELLAGQTAREVEETVQQETGQISRVMEAMSATDGGLAKREYEKMQAEQATAVGAAPTAENLPAAELSAPATANAVTAQPAPALDDGAAPAASGQREAPPGRTV
ncbi:MAG: Sec-independent protein translocase protein TatB [Thiobacillaceae bacterium]|jgi:sec-independent protein translocase protein TatB|nr:Sec-independent protein translocase protein TatB [Thiobacillaceae bacterium]